MEPVLDRNLLPGPRRKRRLTAALTALIALLILPTAALSARLLFPQPSATIPDAETAAAAVPVATVDTGAPTSTAATTSDSSRKTAPSSAPKAAAAKQPLSATATTRLIQVPQYEAVASGDAVTQLELDQRLQALDSSLRELIANSTIAASGPGAPISTASFAPSQRIDNLSGVTISNSTIDTASLPDLSGKYLSLNGGTITGTTTFADNVGIGTTDPWTKLSIVGGLAATASSTIGDGTQTGGLTINGGATTTGNAYVMGSLSLGTSTQSNKLTLQGGGIDLNVGSNWAEETTYSSRVGVGIPVPYVQPAHASSSIAFDVVPSAGASNFSGNTGVAWIDLCDSAFSQACNVQGNPNYETLRLGIFANGTTYVSSAAGGSGTVHSLGLQTNGGYVGIGSANPTSLLDVISAIGSDSVISLTAAGTRRWQLKTLSSGGAFAVTDQTASAERLRIDTSGNVGIGTTNPWSKLSINGGLAATASSTIGDGTQAGGLTISGGATTTGNAYFAGNVGIGTTSPDANLNVYGTTQLDGNLTLASNGYIKLDSAGLSYIDAKNPNSTFILNANQYFQFTRKGSLIAQIGSGGGGGNTYFTSNVGIGTTSPLAKLDVAGGNNSTTPLLQLSSVSGYATTTEFIVNNDGSAVLAGSLTQNSDERLKKNIDELSASSTLALVEQLKPVTYQWADASKGTTTQLGFIAQDVQKLFPELVSTTSATSLTPGGTLGLNYIGLISPVVRAVQEIAAISGAFEHNLVAWLGNASNGIKDLFATNGHFTSELCVGSTCVTPAQFQAMVAAASASQSTADSGGLAAENTATSTDATDTAPVIEINGSNPALISVGSSYVDLGARIVAPQADTNLGIKTFLNGKLVSNIVVDTSKTATDTIDYVVTGHSRLTSTSTRTVIVKPVASSIPIVSPSDASAGIEDSTASSSPERATSSPTETPATSTPPTASSTPA